MSCKKDRERRKKLIERQRNRCFWCKSEMTQPHDFHTMGKVPDPRSATLDHLDDRWSAERGLRSGEYRTVAACLECNRERGRQKDLSIPIDVRRQIAGRFPRSEDVR